MGGVRSSGLCSIAAIADTDFPLQRRLSPTSSTGQHVPLAQFYHNLKAIILHPSMRAHTSPPSNSSASTKIILVTPPPVDEYQLEDINPEIQRTAEHTRKYVDACLQLSKDMAIPCLDLWSIMMKKAGWEGKEGEELVGCKKRERSKVLNDLLSDGLLKHTHSLTSRVGGGMGKIVSMADWQT